MTTTATVIQEALERRMTVRAKSIHLSDTDDRTERCTSLADGDLVVEARSGSESAMAELFARHESAVFRLAHRLLRSADDADDIRQESFVRAFSSLERFRQDASFKTYVLTICSNLCRDRLRGRQRHPEVSYGLDPSSGRASCPASVSAGDPAQIIERDENGARVRAALDSLPPPYREALHLRHVEELSVEEIARVVGCSRFAAPVRLFRARKAFQAAYLHLVKQEDGE